MFKDVGSCKVCKIFRSTIFYDQAVCWIMTKYWPCHSNDFPSQLTGSGKYLEKDKYK